MAANSLFLADASEPEEDAERETEAQGEIDDTFASRRLRRWLKSMFGGPSKPPADADEDS